MHNNKEYKLRERVHNLANNPLQKFGPWKYYTNFVPVPFGCFKAMEAYKTLSLTCLIQGFYDSGTDLMVQDTMSVFLRNNSPPYIAIDSSKVLMSSSGTGTFSFPEASGGTPYYIQVKHRNSIETWSSSAQSFTNNWLTYDFAAAASKAYGDNLIQVDTSPVRFAIFSGDANQDGAIDLTDIIKVYNDANLFVVGYVSTDINGDEFVDLSDLTITYNNSKDFVIVISP